MEYRIVYKYKKNNKEYVIEAGQYHWIPSKEIADRILKHYSEDKLLYRDKVLYLEKRDGAELLLKRNPEDNKIIWTKDYAYLDAYEVGEYIDDELANIYANCVPPTNKDAHSIKSYFQIGEPHDSQYDENRGIYRDTYATFVKVSKDLWKYCGNCFCGQKIA